MDRVTSKPGLQASSRTHGGLRLPYIRLKDARAVAGYLLPPVIALVTLAVVWEVWTRVGDVKPYILPGPVSILDRLFGDLGYFARHGAITLGEAMAGFALGASVAAAGATLMAHSRFLERSLFPVAVLIKVTPIVAVAPLFVIWFGFGSFPKISPEALDLFRSLNASRTDVFLKLRVPSSLPYLFAAFRIAIPLSVIGAVVGEWFTGDRGLGSVIIVAHNNLHMDTLFSAVLVLAFIGISLTILTAYAERRVLFWHDSSIVS